MTTFGLTGLALCLSLGLSTADPAAAEDPITLKFAVFTPEQEITYQEAMVPWARAVEEETGGKVKIQMYPGGLLGRDGSKQLKMLKDGVADIAFFFPAYSPGIFVDNWVPELPNTARTSTEASLAIWGMIEDGHYRGFDGLEPLAMVATSPFVVHSTKPVNSVDDLKGRKFRAITNLEQTCIKAVGGVPVGLPVYKAAESLSRGVIEVVNIHYAALFAFGMGDSAPYHYHSAFGTSPFGFAMTKEKFDSLPQEVRDAMHKHGGEALARVFGAAMDAESARREAEIKADPDQTIVIPSEAEQAKWATLMQGCTAEFVAEQDNGAALHQEWVARVEKARSE